MDPGCMGMLNTVMSPDKLAQIGMPLELLNQSDLLAEMSLVEDDEAYFIKVDVPGGKESDLELSVANNVLTLKGKRELWNRESMKACDCERFDGHYRRVFALDNTLDAGKIEAKLSQGVLELTVPKIGAAKPKKIEIKTS